MSLMTGLNAIALSLWAGLDSYFFPLLIWPLVAGLLAQLLLRVGTPTDSLVPILRVLTFSQQLSRRLLMLWVILFFSSGVQRLRGISSDGVNLGDSGILWHSTEPLLSLVSCFDSLNCHVSLVSDPTMRLLFLVLLLYSCLYSSSILWDSHLGSLRRVSVSRRFSGSFSSSRAFIIGRSIPSI